MELRELHLSYLRGRRIASLCMRHVLLQDPDIAVISMWMTVRLSFNFAIIIHRPFSVVRMNAGLLIEVLAQTTYACVGEDAEDISLVVVELLWCWSAKSGQLFMKEGLNTRQAKMR
jgi:hypothetical protein